MGIRALEGGLPKYGKNQRIFIFGNGVFTGKMPTFRPQIFFLEQQILKKKLHILSLLCRAQCTAIHIDTNFSQKNHLFQGVTLWLLNHCFRGQKWKGNMYFEENVLTDFHLDFYRTLTHAFDSADQTTERGISKNWILRDFFTSPFYP